MDTRRALLDRFARDFIGSTAGTPWSARAATRAATPGYLDTTPTALMPRMVWESLERCLEAASATAAPWPTAPAGTPPRRRGEPRRHRAPGGLQPGHRRLSFTGNGATGAPTSSPGPCSAGIRSLVERFPEGAPPRWSRPSDRAGAQQHPGHRRLLPRPLVVASVMEHRSDLLPWMEAVGHHHVRAVDINPATGALDLAHLERILAEERQRSTGGDHRRLHSPDRDPSTAWPGWPTPPAPRSSPTAPSRCPRSGGHAPGNPPSASTPWCSRASSSTPRGPPPSSRRPTLTGRRCVTDVGGGWSST